MELVTIYNIVQLLATIVIPNLWIIFFIFRLILENSKEPQNIMISLLISLIGYISGNLLCQEFEFFNTEKLNLILGVPCIPEDIPKLNNLIENINNQTRLPDGMILGLSETHPTKGKELQNQLNKISKFPVKVSTVTCKAFSGINRNRIAEEINSQYNEELYIVYLDADDLMHPQRFELVEKVLLKNNKPLGLVHGLDLKNNSDKKFTIDNNVWKGKQLYDFHKNKVPRSKYLDLRGLNLHHGHPVYSKKIFNDVKFTNMRRGQDAEMLRNVLDFYGNIDSNIHFLQLPLSIYYPRKKLNY